VAAGVTIEMESPTEAARVVQAGEQLGLRPRVAIRVNPDFRVKGSGMRMGGGPQQFGVDAETVPALMADLATSDVELLGFHVFAGSQNLDAGIICEAQRRTAELVVELAASGGRRSGTSTSAVGSASPTSRRTSRSTSRPSEPISPPSWPR
jgi:diaminopimelate decarboxylase